METKDKLFQLIQGIKNSELDIKAEAYLAIAGNECLINDQFVVSNSGAFKRTFQKDILEISLEEDKTHKEYINIKLNREGIYDLLPEGIFHHSTDLKRGVIGTHEMALQVRKNKKIEAECRKFFAPLENSIFAQKLNIESEEYSLIKGLDFGEMDFDLMGFYGLPLDLPKEFIQGFLRIMPHKHLVSGDYKLAENVLSMIIKHPVEFRFIQDSNIPNIKYERNINFGDFGKLGTETILGDWIQSSDQKIEVKVGPIGKNDIQDYFEGGIKKRVLDIFYGFFMPMDVEMETKLRVKENCMNMVLETDGGPILGYTSAFTN
ncbi:type VI secretion system baseplate subunit TssG [Cognataquiflexum rubidum]|uniref:type VI secretion system baseplate subunit TssG n=1 Tax=Cognataquiflexum rubidum TaxID=2922273 RepID=UPI001F1328A4|nr:type VI secretion system baseplate subunit TssG [Cognataquiflexum rubidum]MCH6234204.1 type VI secretion system baseplate subunit TssG [Cognataquiflexum rubidum]